MNMPFLQLEDVVRSIVLRDHDPRPCLFKIEPANRIRAAGKKPLAYGQNAFKVWILGCGKPVAVRKDLGQTEYPSRGESRFPQTRERIVKSVARLEFIEADI